MREPARHGGATRPAAAAGALDRVELVRLTSGVAFLALAAAACDVQWGGARMSLEDPAPPPPAPEVTETPDEERVLPLPEGPFLYLIRPEGPTGALVTPVAAIPPEGGAPADLDLPDALSEEFRARFDSAYLRAGSEMTLQRRGARIGSVVLSDARRQPDPSCPSVAEGSLLLLPGQRLSGITVALPRDLSPTAPEAAREFEPPRGMSVAAPVIAERLIGGDRAYLAQRVSLQAVPVSGEAEPAMAATYLIEDSLAVGPPGESAVSLFFLSTPDPARGYVTRWSELRRYGAASEKEAFEYLDWARLRDGELHLLRMYGADAVRLAGDFVPAGAEPDASRRVEWTESPTCPALERLEGR